MCHILVVFIVYDRNIFYQRDRTHSPSNITLSGSQLSMNSKEALHQTKTKDSYSFARWRKRLLHPCVGVHVCVMYRAHSLPPGAEFPAEPRNLGLFPRNLSGGIHHGIRLFFRGNSAEFDVFHSNNYFFTENDLKVALLQVCL